ncbi:hypothetical protein [Celeribacter ethanolicus]|nr:hypothetical protein [Celeribacter ethanolicus]
MFDLMRTPATILPVDPYGEVIRGQIDHILTLPHPRMAWPLASIEIHQHTDERWMWAVNMAGGGYRVGEKWGKFADSRDDATHYAAKEVLTQCERVQDPNSIGISKAQLHQIEAWAEVIASDPARAHLMELENVA